MLEFNGGLDRWLEPPDDDEGEPCLTKCPKCHGTANGIQHKAGKEQEDDGLWVTRYEVTGIDCEECGYQEGDECYEVTNA